MKSKLEICRYGTKRWKLPNGKLHNEDGPAIICSNGDKSWHINGKCHREDGPAVMCANGNKSWLINGKLHREDGPAVERHYGTKKWYLNGIEYKEQEYKKKIRLIKLELLL